MKEPEEFNLLLNLVAGVGALMFFAAGGCLYFLLGRPSITNKFPVVVPIRGAVLSLLGVFAILFVIGGVSLIFRLFSH